MKALATILVLLASAGCHNPPSHPAFNYGADLGVAIVKAGHACLYIANGGLSAGQRVQFVTSAPPGTVGEVEIVGKADDTCKDSIEGPPGVSGYLFKVIRGELKGGAPAFAIANFGKTLTPTENGVAADLDGDGQPALFRTCTSTEGVHLTIWKGQALQGARKWHNYFYLGYDVTPTCTDGETKPNPER